MAASPIYEALKTKLRMTPWDGGQEAANFDMVILDGDTFGVQQLQDDELIHSAVRSGVWVLSLDAAEEQKLNGVGHLLGAGTPEKSHAYLARLTRSPNGHPSSTYVDFRDGRADTVRQAQRIVEYVEGEGLQAQQANDQEPTDPPKGALMWEHRVTQPWDIMLPRNNHPENPGRPIQTASWTQTYDIRLYLANDSDNPAGTSQWVAIEQKGEATPNQLAINYTDCTVDNSCPDDPGINPNYEIAWPQTLFIPQASISGNLFALNDSSPQNQNNASSVTTTSGFSIGVNQAQGGFGTYTYSTSATRVISEWKAENDSNPAATNPTASWRFGSADPYDGFNTKTGSGFLADPPWPDQTPPPDESLFIAEDSNLNGNVKQPNQLSAKNFAYATASVWQLKGQTPSTETVSIGGVDTAWYVDAYTWSSQGSGEGVYGYVARYNNQHPWGLNVDLGAVVPVPLKQGGFGVQQADGTVGNEITGGQPATGVVTLAAPANADAKVYLGALTNDYGVTIPTDSITIPKGETTGTFTIESAALCSNGAARITAFYGGQLNQEITVVKPPSCN
jgi:hypothetical protein